MASAGYFWRNYDIKQVINLMCYMTEYPHTLTSTQKITRMYRCMVRRQYQYTINQNRTDPLDYHSNVRIAREKLSALLDVPENSALFRDTLQFFEKRVRTNMDPTMMFKDCRQYSAVNGRAYVWTNEQLLSDPFGYYTGKKIGHRTPAYGFLYYPNFPMESHIWHMDPPSEYDDSVDVNSFKN